MAAVGLPNRLLKGRLMGAAALLRLMPGLSAPVRRVRALPVGRPGPVHRRAFAHLGGRGLHPGDALAGESLNRADRLAINGRDDRYRGAAAAGATSSANSMHIVIGMMRYVEIQNVTDFGNIQTARGDVRCNQQLGLA